MSHFTVLVIGQNVEEQLQPYHEYECTGIEDEYVVFVPAWETKKELQEKFEETKEMYKYETFNQFMTEHYGYHQENGVWGSKTNPNAEWDWYQIGGRWSGFLKTKEGKEGALGCPSFINNDSIKGGADIISKGDVDWEGMREDGGKVAETRYDIVWEGIKDTPEGLTWEQCREKVQENKCHELYNNQPRVKKFKEVCHTHKDLFNLFSCVEDYQQSKVDYIEEKKNSSITTYSVIKDGVWFSKGEMGWNGGTKDKTVEDDWNKKYWEIIQSTPDNELLTMVDCHI